MKIYKEQSLGDIVTNYPSTVKIMNKYKFDYCCGGDQTLEDTVRITQLDINIILNELNITAKSANKRDNQKWSEKSLSEVIDYILDNHHTFMKEALVELNELVLKILKVHYHTNGDTLIIVHKLFGELKTELEAHLIKEEENLFPLIKKYEKTNENDDKANILQIIKNTEYEHDVAGDLFKELEEITNDFTPPIDACYSFKRTYELLDLLEKDTFNHIHMENSILFKKLN